MLPLRKAWLWLAGALIPLAAGASTNLPTTIVQNGAPISIDQCVALQDSAQGKAGYVSELVDFTNVSQQTATEVRFALEIVDSTGHTEQTLTFERAGDFAAGAAVEHSSVATANAGDVRQAIESVPVGAKIFCSVKMVRFDGGSVWHDGDGPAGSALMYTPLPGPSPTRQWQWPGDQATP